MKNRPNFSLSLFVFFFFPHFSNAFNVTVILVVAEYFFVCIAKTNRFSRAVHFEFMWSPFYVTFCIVRSYFEKQEKILWQDNNSILLPIWNMHTKSNEWLVWAKQRMGGMCVCVCGVNELWNSNACQLKLSVNVCMCVWVCSTYMSVHRTDPS